MAINPDTRHDNNHSMVAACSGGGKSQIIGQLLIPKTVGARVFLWDGDEDYKASRYYSRAAYARAVAAAIKGKKGFRLAFSGAPTVDNFRWWCRVVWTALDGNKITHVIIEELADVSPSAGKAVPEFGELLRKGRKYGAIITMATQRGQEVPKTAWTQVKYRLVGQQEAGDRLKMAKEAGISSQAIEQLQPLQFYKKTMGASEPELITLKGKKVN